MNVSNMDTDVLVVGSGPTGATTALALATYGVRTRVVTQFNWLSNTPRAHITNQRALEVLRDLGVQADVEKYATPWDQMGDTLFTTSLAGEELARLRTWGTGDLRHGDYVKGSPCPLLDVPQNLMEPLLVKNAAERGASFSFNTEYVSHAQDDEGVSTLLRDRHTGAQYHVRSRYLVGADGANSKVLADADLAVEGQLARAGTVYVLFNADLRRYVEHRPSILYWVATSSASFGEIGQGLLRAIRPWSQWIAGWGFDISKGEPDTSDAFVTSQIRTLVGDPGLQPEIVKKSIWYVNQAYATRYSRGRVFCGGDAVHRHPPSSGLGSNTCMQDAFNLAWKLAYVVKGYAGPDLLETYTQERAPIGKQVVERANQSRLDYKPLNECFRDRSDPDPVAAGIRLLKSPGVEGQQRRAALRAALELKNDEFNAQGIEMNQRYHSSAVIEDPHDGEEVWRQDPKQYLQATTRPGAKLPHAWLVDSKGLRVSTLDVVGKGLFSLVTGLGGQHWVEAVELMALPFLRPVVIGAPGSADAYGNWALVSEVEETAAILVRPDGHVAWRHRGPVGSMEVAQRLLIEALSSILSQQPVTQA